MTESNLTDLPDDDDEDTIGVPGINGREHSAPELGRDDHMAFRGPHADATVPVCTQCRMAHGSIKTGTGMLCAACWSARIAQRQVEGSKKPGRVKQ